VRIRLALPRGDYCRTCQAGGGCQTEKLAPVSVNEAISTKRRSLLRHRSGSCSIRARNVDLIQVRLQHDEQSRALTGLSLGGGDADQRFCLSSLSGLMVARDPKRTLRPPKLARLENVGPPWRCPLSAIIRTPFAQDRFSDFDPSRRLRSVTRASSIMRNSSPRVKSCYGYYVQLIDDPTSGVDEPTSQGRLHHRYDCLNAWRVEVSSVEDRRKLRP